MVAPWVPALYIKGQLMCLRLSRASWLPDMDVYGRIVRDTVTAQIDSRMAIPALLKLGP